MYIFLGPFLVPTHEMCFLLVCVIALQTRNERKVPYNLPRTLLSTLVAGVLAHWTHYTSRVLVLIDDAIIDARVVSSVRQIKRAQDFLGLIDSTRQRVPFG